MIYHFAVRLSSRRFVSFAVIVSVLAAVSLAYADGVTLHITARFVYTRPGIDGNSDGDFDDTGDVPPMTVGADAIYYEIVDDDSPDFDEVMYSGYTDIHGYVDATFDWDDCDITGCDDPDIYLRFECTTPWVDVEDAGVFEGNYSWDNEDELEGDFQGTGIDFGELTPDDPAEFPAVHIHNSLTRAYRFILDNVGTDVAHVDVQWPDGDSGARYDGEIHVGSAEQWAEGAHIKQYGRHYLENYSQNPEFDFCNCVCDIDCTNDECGHCTWCAENNVAAWIEGWTNWVGSVVNRSYLGYYGFDPLSINDPRFTLESLEQCPQDGAFHDPLTTEGFLGALCRDIEDDTQDDHGLDSESCTRDSLALGADEIFDIVRFDEPTTPSQFIIAFRSRFPQYDGGLWRTGINVGGPIYVWNDTEPPGVVASAWSPTHPDGFLDEPGGTSPFITVKFEHAPDDASGAVAYSIVWSDQPGVEPDDSTAEYENPDATTCSVTSPPFDLGEYYLSLRARDCTGNWSQEWMSFGPFAVTECNANGIIDICETDCDAIPGFCEEISGCGTIGDCNTNHVPDECDVADASSGDCDVNGVPDECEAADVKSWVGGTGAWYGSEQNWDDGTFPAPGDLVCINVPDQVALVAHSQGVTDIASLGCYEMFTLDGSSTLRPSGSAAFFEALSWRSGTHSAPDGTPPDMAHTSVYGPMALVGESSRTLASRTLNIMNELIFAEGGSLYLDSGAVLNNLPDATFDISADGDIYWTSGTSISTINNQGAFTKSGGAETGQSYIYPIFVNSGLLDVQSSQMTFLYGGLNVVEPGVVLVGADATLYLDSVLANGNHHFGDGTSMLGNGNVTFDENALIEGEYEMAGITKITHGVIDFTSADEAVNIENYVQTGGTLTGTDDVTTVNLLEWTGGAMTVPDGTPPDTVHTFAEGGMTLSGSSFRELIGRTLSNFGDATLDDNGNLYMNGAAILNNLPKANFEITSSGDIYWTTSTPIGTINNLGYFIKSGGTEITPSYIYPIFVNSGLLDVQAGSLAFYYGGLNLFEPGVVQVGADAVLHLSSLLADSIHHFGPGTIATGNGNLLFHADALIEGEYAVTGVTTITNGLIEFSSADETASVQNYVQTGGTLTGTDDVTAVDSLEWVAGTMTVPPNTPPDAVHTIAQNNMTLLGNGTRALSGRTLDNLGDAAFYDDGSIYLNEAAVLNNGFGATFDILADGDIYWVSNTEIGTINNGGTFTKSGGADTGATYIYPIFNNLLFLDVQAGTMRFLYGGLDGINGIVQVADGATLHLDFTLTQHRFHPNSIVEGDGDVIFDDDALIEGEYVVAGITMIRSGVIDFTSAGEEAVVANYVQTGGTLSGVDDLETINQLSWTAGTMTVPDGTPPDSVHTIAEGGMSLNGNNFRTVSGRTLDNLGLSTLADSGSLWLDDAAVLNNPPGAVFDIVGDGDIFWTSNTAASEINNGGIFTKSGGNATSYVYPALNNTGLVRVQAGMLWFFFGGLTQTEGLTLLDGGNIRSEIPVNIHGGVLAGDGTVTGDVNTANTGAVSPGQSAGVIDIVGSYTQTVGGELEIELGGYGQGDEFDLLAISGPAALDGLLHVSLINGFVPQIGDQFVVLTSGARTGMFANVTTSPPTLQINVIYGVGSVTIQIVDAPEVLCATCPGDANGDNNVDGDDVGPFVTCLLGGATACDCADMDGDADVDSDDVVAFAAKLLNDPNMSCP